MKINCAYAEVVDIHTVIPNPKNPNIHPDKQIERLSKLIDYQGQRHPVIISKRSGFVVVGHGRLEAIKKLGWGQIAVDYQDFENEAQEYAFVVSDNAIAEWAEMDMSCINMEIGDFGPEFDIDFLGLENFTIDVADKLPDVDPDEIPDVEHAITRKGDVWLLGKHRLMCGDSTMIDEIEKLMCGEKADMIFTDPPYGVSYTGGLGDSGDGLKSNKRSMIKNDDIDLYYEAVTIANQFCNGPIFMFYADTVPFGLYSALKDVGAKIVALIIWKKKGGYGALGASYKQNHEPCLIWVPKGKNINFIGDTSENRVWEIDKDGLNKLHPTQKPVAIPKRAIGNHNAKIVLDMFGGSGSTMIASEELGRHSRLMELDEKYCDVIIKRWENFTGKKATLEMTGQTYDELKSERDGEGEDE